MDLFETDGTQLVEREPAKLSDDELFAALCGLGFAVYEYCDSSRVDAFYAEFMRRVAAARRVE